MVLTSRDLLVFILASYAVVVAPFVDAGSRNYLVLFAAVLGGVLFFLLRLALKRQAVGASILFGMMFLLTLLNGGTADLGSFALTCVYALGYFAIASLLDRVRDKRAFVQTMMRRIIYAFAILSLIQMVTSIADLPIPNLLASKGFWSYNSLAYEPSQLGRVVGISMLCYLMLERLPGNTNRPRETRKEQHKALFAFLVTMLLSGSSLASVAILFVYGLSRSLILAIVLGAAGLLFFPMVQLIDYEPLQRAANLLSSLQSLDLHVVLEAEHSGGLRFAPFLVYLRDASLSEFGFWFGYGSDGLADFFQYKIAGLGDTIAAGFIPGFAVVYGVLVTAFFIWVFVLRLANRTTVPLIVFWFIFMSTSAWNTQVLWYGLIVIQIAWSASREISSTKSVKPT